MKKILTLSFLISVPFLSSAQTGSSLDLEAYFSAILVSDFESSINWYSNTLGFKVLNRIESNERGFKQSNLKRGDVLIELIELDKSVKLEDIVPDYSNKMRVIGLFKIGFLVTDFEKWINHLNNEKVNFYGNIVTDDITGKRMAIITDPDGNRIQIFEK
jgi:catechol-2,3-dioxygenase